MIRSGDSTADDLLLMIVETVRAKKERHKINSYERIYLYPSDGFFPGGVLFEEHFFHQGAGVDDFRVRYAVKNVDPGPSCRQNALVAHHGKVLGDIRLGRPESGHQFGHCFFLGFEGIEDFDALRVGEGFADLCLHFEDGFVGQDAFHAFFVHLSRFLVK